LRNTFIPKSNSQKLLLVASSFLVVGYFSWTIREFRLDDALIYLRYVRNFFNGHGLVYNPGILFNGLTSPLFAYTTIILNSIIGNLQVTSIFTGFMFFSLATLLGALITTKDLEQGLFTILFLGSFNYFYSTFGMESPLFLFFVALSIFYYMEEKYFLLGIALGLTFLSRSEGIFLCLIITLDYTVRKKKLPHPKYMLVPSIIVLCSFLFNKYYYGAFLPSTFSAKISHGQSGFWGDGFPFLNLEYMKKAFFADSSLLLIFFLGTSLVGFVTRLRERVTFLITGFLCILSLFYITLKIPNYHWYYAPFYYFGIIYSALGVWATIKMVISVAGKKINAYFITVTVICCYGFCIYNSLDHSNKSNKKRSTHHLTYKKIGIWLKENTPKASSVGLVEIGAVGWYSERFIVDILGLTNKHNADYIGDRDIYSWLKHYQPDYILTRQPIRRFEMSTKLLLEKGAYKIVDEFHFHRFNLFYKDPNYGDDNIAMLPEARLRALAESVKDIKSVPDSREEIESGTN